MSSKWLCTIILAGAACAQAAPNIAPTAVADESAPKHRGIVSRLDDMRHSVQDNTAQVITNAMNFIGVPYRHGGESAETGFDCSGLVRALYAQAWGTILPRRADEQAAATEKIDKSELKPGDLVFFNTMRRAFSHVGIYMGDGKFIHAPRTGARVRIEDMTISYWQRRFDGARRVEGSPELAMQLTKVGTDEKKADDLLTLLLSTSGALH
ncbi:hypothetical protein GCM10027082_37140 [Comamonas humi]